MIETLAKLVHSWIIFSFKSLSSSSMRTTKPSFLSSLWGELFTFEIFFLATYIVEEVRDVLAMAWWEARVELDVPILADEVVGADFSEDEVEDVLVELAHQFDGQLVWDEEVAVGEHVRETPDDHDVDDDDEDDEDGGDDGADVHDEHVW